MKRVEHYRYDINAIHRGGRDETSHTVIDPFAWTLAHRRIPHGCSLFGRLVESLSDDVVRVQTYIWAAARDPDGFFIMVST